MKNSLVFYPSFLLLGCGLVQPGLLHANPNFYGNITPGILISTNQKIDQTKDGVDIVCQQYAPTRPTDCGPSENEKFTAFSYQHSSSSAGMNFLISDKVAVNFELGPMLTNDVDSSGNSIDAGLPLALRTYSFSVDVGKGSVMVGRQARPFAAITSAANNMKFVFDDSVAGTLNQKRNLGVTYQSHEVLGMVNLHAGLFNPSKPGPKQENNSTETPAVDIAAHFTFSPQVTASLGLLMENLSDYVDNNFVSYNASIFGFNVMGNFAGFKGTMSYASGNPLYKKATRMANLNKAAKEKVDGLDFWLETQLRAVHLGIFYGLETGHLAESEGRRNKDDNPGNVLEVGSALGIHVGYQWNDVEWMLEYGNQKLSYDGITVNNKTYFGLAANLNWAS